MPKGQNVDERVKKKIRDLRHAMTTDELAERFGLSSRTVRIILEEKTHARMQD